MQIYCVALCKWSIEVVLCWEQGDNCCSLQLALEFRGETHINSHKPHYIIYRLESLCKSDLAKVRLRLGNSAAATFQLNSSLVPGRVFNCHLELALDSSKLGKKWKQQSEENTKAFIKSTTSFNSYYYRVYEYLYYEIYLYINIWCNI